MPPSAVPNHNRPVLSCSIEVTEFENKELVLFGTLTYDLNRSCLLL